MSLSAIQDGVRWFSDAKMLRQPLVALFDANQTQSPQMQVWSLAAAYYLMCEACELDAHELIGKAKNARKNLNDNNQHEWEAMVEMIRNEWK